ncbi:ParA family protein [Desulfonatronum lacustre]|uniref:ParA family protein n=1 Tax=Desulfonatronum lacustre TaxID=66849 RepID=UPI00048CE0BA|nr:ParA family protein [Desulfonatronum lacustre]SMP70951.1 chromosome partitioning protein [Desulfonatronum zhilinae]
MKPTVLAVANQKGGVGKTTTALSLAAALGETGRRVLVMDLDPHACASIHLGFYPEEERTTLYDLFREEDPGKRTTILDAMISPAVDAGFDAAPSHIRLSELEMDLRDRAGKGAILKQCMGHLENRYDYVVLDCPPHVGILLVNALVACDLVIIPMQTDFLALHGVRLIFATMKTLNKALPKPIDFRILPTMFDRRAGACQRVLRLLRQKAASKMFETIIPMDTKFREASGLGKTILGVAPSSKGAQAYRQLARELTANENA